MKKSNKNKVCIQLFFLLIMVTPALVHGGQDIVMVTYTDLDISSKNLTTMIYEKAFDRLGYSLVVKQFPAKRASIMADRGSVDGELLRANDYIHTHPNLIRVEVSPFYPQTYAAYSMDSTVKLDGWQSLEGTVYKINYKRGYQRAKEKLVPIVAPENLEAINRSVLGLRKLIIGRIEIYIDAEHTINTILTTKEFKGTPVHTAGIMESITMHAYLHKRHEKLASKLSQMLGQMKLSGEIKKYRSIILK